MTPKFIERHCRNCEHLCQELHPFNGDVTAEYCGDIDEEDGVCYGYLDDLKSCKKGYKK